MYPFSSDAIGWVVWGFPLAIAVYYWFGRLVLGRHSTRRESRRQKAQRTDGADFWNPWFVASEHSDAGGSGGPVRPAPPVATQSARGRR